MVTMALRGLVAFGMASLLVSLPGDVPQPLSPKDVAYKADAGVVRLSEREWRLSRAGMIRRMTRDFVQVISIAERGMTPLYEGDRLAGYRVGRMEQCAFYRDLGLRNGDIIRSVNGESLQSLYEMYLKFRFISQADVVIERDGQRLTFRYWID